MEYKTLTSGERLGKLGLGTRYIADAGKEGAVKIIRAALNHGVNLIDLAPAKAAAFSYAGEAIKNRRKDVYLQIHFGIDYETGDYKKTLDAAKIMQSVTWQMQTMRIDYIDFAFLHSVESAEDLETLTENGTLDLLKELKHGRVVHHLGFDTNSCSAAEKAFEEGCFDTFMVPVNRECAADPQWQKIYAACIEKGINVIASDPLSPGLKPEESFAAVFEQPCEAAVPAVSSLEEMYQYLSCFR